MAPTVWDHVLSWLLESPNLWDIHCALIYMIPKAGDLIIGLPWLLNGFKTHSKRKCDALLNDIQVLASCSRSCYADADEATARMIGGRRWPALHDNLPLRLLHSLQMVLIDFAVIAYNVQCLGPSNFAQRHKELRLPLVATVCNELSAGWFCKAWCRLAMTSTRTWHLFRQLTIGTWHENILKNPLMLRGRSSVARRFGVAVRSVIYY
jgi:hypothetical protein